MALAFCVPANLLVLLRILFKAYEANSFQADDYMISATLVSGVLGAVVNICGVAANGLGRDIWTIEFGQINNFAKFFYIMTILYTLTLNLLKLSMLVFFLRLFPSSVCPRAYKVTMVTTVFTALFTCALLMVVLFPCSPVNFFWQGWDGEHSGSCVNMKAAAWSYAIIGILLDIWMLAIPLSQVRALKLSPLKMLGVGLMFLVGLVYVLDSLALQIFKTNSSVGSPLSASFVSNLLGDTILAPKIQLGTITRFQSGLQLRSLLE